MPNMLNLATVRLRPDVVWRLGDKNAPALDTRLLHLLAAIKQHATLRAAAAQAGLSYRAAWGLIGDTGRLLGIPLVELQQGRGTRLTDAGEQLLVANERVLQRLRDEAFALELAVQRPRKATRARTRLAVTASHDLLLTAFCDGWAKPEDIVGEVTYRGSVDSLKAFAGGEADIAGFHSVAPFENKLAAGFRRLLDPRRDVLLRFAEREQGLMVRQGNPLRLRSLADVARQQAHFVNRQRGSGTRLLIDQLFKQAGIAPPSIRGYETEEYTHLAVAATVAAGQADVGFGLRAAATRLGLDFVPLSKEIYWLATRARRLEGELMQRLRAGLAGKPLHVAASGLTGYSIADAGLIVPVSAIV